MSLKTIAVLLCILAVFVGIALWQGRSGARLEGPAAGSLVLKDTDVNAIFRIEIAAAGSTSVVERKEGRWVVPSMHGYHADFEKVSRVLRGLAELEIGQLIRDADQYPDEFGLGKDSPAVSVTLTGAAGGPVALILGGSRQAGGEDMFMGYEQNRYLRMADGSVALVDAEPLREISASPAEWIRKDLLTVPVSEIEKISVSVSNSEFTVKSKEPGRYEVAQLGKDEEADAAGAGRLAGALQNLRCEGIADPKLNDDETGFESPVKYTATTRDGREYTALVGGTAPGGARYVRLSVAFTEPPAPSREDVEKDFPAEEKSEGEKASAPEKSREEKIQEEFDRRVKAHQERASAARKKVDEQNARFTGWTFLVPGYMSEALTMSRSQVVKSVEKQEEPKAGDKPAVSAPRDGNNATNAVPARENKRKKPRTGKKVSVET